MNNWQVGLWHEPKQDDARFTVQEQALAVAVRMSLRADTSLFCVWEWDSPHHATERFLLINGQTWAPHVGGDENLWTPSENLITGKCQFYKNESTMNTCTD